MNSMRNFLIALSLFILTFVAVSPLSLLLPYQKFSQANKSFYSIIEKSKRVTKKKKLIIGDSVSGQLFPNNENGENYYFLTSSGTIGVLGQFFLLNNFFNAGNQVDTVIYLSGPAFQNSIHSIYAYNNVLKVFYNQEYMPLFSDLAKREIEKIPYHSICQYPLVVNSSWSPEYDYEIASMEAIKMDTTRMVSDLSKEYLLKIKELTKKHNSKLIILPVPKSELKRNFINAINASEWKNTELEEELDYYYTNIWYLPESEFTDGVHLKQPEKYVMYYSDKWGIR